MTKLPSVAIAGATGHLGQYIAKACLSAAANGAFSKVVLLSRNSVLSSPQLSEWQDQSGAVIRSYDEEDLSQALTDVDVLVNTIGPSGHDFKDALLRALPKTPIQLYFPSEFGCDHTVHDFPHEEWNHKKQHYKIALEVAPRIKICRIFNGLFLEDSIGPWLGFSVKSGRFESVGSANTATSYTALSDVGRAVAILAAMKPDCVPSEVHLGGNTVTMREIAALMHQEGAGEISVVETDLDTFKVEALKVPSSDPAKYLRFLMGEKKINHTAGSLGNDNSLVNPGEKLWKWQTMHDYAKATNGRPWVDYE